MNIEKFFVGYGEDIYFSYYYLSYNFLLLYFIFKGMTETCLCHTVTSVYDNIHKPYKQAFESVGRPLPFSETKIVDPITGIKLFKNMIQLNESKLLRFSFRKNCTIGHRWRTSH